MHRLLTNAMLASLGLALPLWALGQTAPMPVIPPVHAVRDTHAGKHDAPAPVWRLAGDKVSVTGGSRAGASGDGGASALLYGPVHSAGADVHVIAKTGVTVHAGVHTTHWTPLAPVCAAALRGGPADPACLAPLAFGVQRGELGAGFAGHGIKLDLSVGQSQSESTAAPTFRRRGTLPRVLPAQGGADVAAPLWFRNSTSTSISARGQVNVAPSASLDLGASVGRVQFLPGAGPIAGDTLDQTTLSFGIQHGAVRGMLVGHVLQPELPGAPLDGTQRWGGIDLGISVRLPWRGELTFGAQNLWTSGHAPLLFGPMVGVAPAQGRVPYVQYHQDINL